jgi:hypothetical protein
MFRQQRNIFSSIAKRGQVQRDDIDSVVEILAELSFPDQILEVLARRGDDANVDFDGLYAADAREFAFLQNLQQLGLRHGTEVPDFVEEQGAAVGELELPTRRAVASVNEPFSWPNSSLSINVSGRAAQFNAINGRSRRPLL